MSEKFPDTGENFGYKHVDFLKEIQLVLELLNYFLYAFCVSVYTPNGSFGFTE